MSETMELQSEAVALELVKVIPINPLVVFTGNGLDAVIEEIERQARSIILDISTPQGRKEIASIAHKIAKSKVVDAVQCCIELFKAERERNAAVEREQKLEAARAKAVRDREESERLAALNAQQAERDALAREKAAEERERKRLVDQQQAEAEAARKREADKNHRSSINLAAVSSLVNEGLSTEDAKKAVSAIAKGLIKHVRIEY